MLPISLKSQVLTAAATAAIVTTLTGAAQARVDIKPTVTGIGFGNSRPAAMGLAVRAWTNETRRKYGRAFANYNSARGKSLDCDYVGARGRAFRQRSIGVEGNPNAKWVCSTNARPVGFELRPPRPEFRYGVNATGLGYANRQRVARRRAIRAWASIVRRRYGRRAMPFNQARLARVRCEWIGQIRPFANRRSRQNRSDIGVIGDVNANHVCTATGRPRIRTVSFYAN